MAVRGPLELSGAMQGPDISVIMAFVAYCTNNASFHTVLYGNAYLIVSGLGLAGLLNTCPPQRGSQAELESDRDGNESLRAETAKRTPAQAEPAHRVPLLNRALAYRVAKQQAARCYPNRLNGAQRRVGRAAREELGKISMRGKKQREPTVYSLIVNEKVGDDKRAQALPSCRCWLHTPPFPL